MLAPGLRVRAERRFVIIPVSGRWIARRAAELPVIALDGDDLLGELARGCGKTGLGGGGPAASVRPMSNRSWLVAGAGWGGRACGVRPRGVLLDRVEVALAESRIGMVLVTGLLMRPIYP